jgi:VCBS repeat-containing protein
LNENGPQSITTPTGVLTVTLSQSNPDGKYTLEYKYTLQKNYAQHTENASKEDYNPSLFEQGEADYLTNDWDESKDVDSFTFNVLGFEQVLTVKVQDDGLGTPSDMSGTVTYEQVTASYKLAMCIDLSLSMLSSTAESGNGNANALYMDSRIYATQVAMMKMLMEYADQAGADKIRVSLVGYNTTSVALGESLTLDEALTKIGKLYNGHTLAFQTDISGNYVKDTDGNYIIQHTESYHSNGVTFLASTNYGAGLNSFLSIVQSFMTSDDQVRAYFFSDGVPTSGQASNTAWTNYINTLADAQLKKLDVYTVGIAGAAENNADIEDITGTLGESDAKHVYIPADVPVSFYADTLVSTVGINGHIGLPVTADGVIGDRAFVAKVKLLSDTAQEEAAEEGFLYGIEIDGETGFPQAADGNIGKSTADTMESFSFALQFGQIIFNADGTWVFKPDQSEADNIPSGNTSFNFLVTFMDADGDTLEQNFTFTLHKNTSDNVTSAESPASEVDSDSFGAAGEEATVTASAAAAAPTSLDGTLDSDAGKEILGSEDNDTLSGGAGNDTLSG